MIVILTLFLLVSTIFYASFASDLIRKNAESEMIKIADNTVDMLQLNLNNSIKNYLRGIAEKNLEVIANYYKQYEDGFISEEEAWNKTRELILAQSIGDTGYLYGGNREGDAVIHAYQQGTNFIEAEFVYNMTVDPVQYQEYMWQNPGDEYPRPKAQYSEYFEPWDLLIVASTYREEFYLLIDINDFQEAIQSVKFAESGYMYIIDHDGNMIIHPEVGSGNFHDFQDSKGKYFVQEILEKKNGVINYAWANPGEIEEREKLAVFRSIDELNYIVVSTVYVDELNAGLVPLLQFILVVLIGLLFIVFIISYFWGNYFAKPILQLNKYVQEVSSGNLNLMIDLKRNDELGALSEAFNKMTLNLKEMINKLQLSEEKYRLLFDNAPVGIVNFDAQGNILFCNQGFLDIFQIPMNLARKSNLYKLASVDIRTQIDGILSGDEGVWEGVLENTNAGDIYTKIVYGPLKGTDGVIIGGLAIVEDISEQRKAEQALREREQIFLEELENKVEERTSQLQETLKTLRDTQEHLIQSEKMSALGSLVAGIAHEINTPLGIGVTITSNMQEKTKNILSLYNEQKLKKSDLDKFLKTIDESIIILISNLNKAADLISSFKQTAVDQSSEVKREFNIKEYLEEIIMSMRPFIKKYKIDLEIIGEDNIIIDSYPGALSQIVTNLTMNSLNHAYSFDEDGVIKINFKQEKERLLIEYIDDGKGMSKEVVERIFDPFFTTNRSNGGTGLGLYIVYNLVTQRFGGKIECISKKDEGTTFKINLPI